MTTQSGRAAFAGLPVTRGLTGITAATLFLALLMSAVSVAGLIDQAALYPTAELRHWFVISDAVNLAAGLPFLLISLWMARRGWLIGLLCWPGALLYILYIYMAYLIAVPFGRLFLAWVIMVALSIYTLVGLGVSIDADPIRERLDGHVPARTAAGILIALALLTIARQIGMMVTALNESLPVTPQELAAWISDLVVMCPILLIVGVQLWRRKALGYMAGPGLLLLYGILALGLIPGLALQTPPDIPGIVVIVFMALICLIPFAFFVRGAAASQLY